MAVLPFGKNADVVFSETDGRIRVHSNSQVSALILRTRYDSGAFCNVTMFGRPPTGGEVAALRPIRAHKNVLAYASAHLHDLFTIDEFIYTDNVMMDADEDAIDRVRGVLTGAKYLVLNIGLADTCENFLAQEERVRNNSIMMWCFACKHSCLLLMHATAVLAQNLASLPKDKNYLSMPFEGCLKLLLDESVITANADERCQAAIAWLSHDSVGRAVHVRDIINAVPFAMGSKSINTVLEAEENEMLWENAPDIMRKVMKNTLKRIKTTHPVLAASQ